MFDLQNIGVGEGFGGLTLDLRHRPLLLRPPISASDRCAHPEMET